MGKQTPSRIGHLGMPSHQKVFQHWEQWLYRHSKIDRGSVNCFACGFWHSPQPMPDRWCWTGGTIQRAHIVPVRYGGSNDPDNLHLLCRYCHKASEQIVDREEYLQWAIKRNIADVIWSFGIDRFGLEYMKGIISGEWQGLRSASDEMKNMTLAMEKLSATFAPVHDALIKR